MTDPTHDGQRDAPLTMDADEFRRLGHHLVDTVADFLEGLPERPVVRAESPEALRHALDADAPLPERGTDAGELMERASSLLFRHSLFNGHPRFFGYITSPPAPIGILGDFLAAAVNPNVGAWRLSPMASEMEAQAVRWLADLIGFPGQGGLLVSGGNMANMVGLLAARAAAEPGVRSAGVDADDGLRVYVSAETHTWVQKAADLAGLGTEAIRWIETDRSLRMDVAALRNAMESDREAGLRPMMVVGTAGSVSTGAVDPLPDMAALCQEMGVWFHVDGAYGALAAVLPDAPADLHGLRDADSVAVDPHKWLYAPLEVGCTLVRDPATLRNAFAYHPPYYHFGQEATNYVDMGPQNSRGFRALKVWLALQHAGRDGYRRMIGDDVRLARRLRERVEAHPELEAMEGGLSITTFRYVPAGLTDPEDLNTLNQAVLERIQQSGEAFVSNAVIRGRYALRACIVNFHTREADVDALPGLVARLGQEAYRELFDGGVPGD